MIAGFAVLIGIHCWIFGLIGYCGGSVDFSDFLDCFELTELTESQRLNSGLILICRNPRGIVVILHESELFIACSLWCCFENLCDVICD